jgi:hypothetical protein
MAGGDDDLGVGLQRRISVSVAKPSVGAVGIGRQAEVERDHRGLVQRSISIACRGRRR